MKTTIALLAGLGLLQTQAFAQFTQFVESFEGYAAGSNLSGQGGWTAAGTGTGATVTVSDAYSYAGSHSLLVTDTSSTLRPLARYTFGETLTQATITFAVFEDPSDDGDSDRWTVNFGTFSLSRDASNLALGYSGGGAGTTTFPRSIALGSTAYDASEWNLISLTIDNSIGLVALSVNGVAAFTFTNTAYTWNATRAELGAYSGARNADVVYFDAISVVNDAAIPEPSSFAALAGLGCLAATALRRRGRAGRAE